MENQMLQFLISIYFKYFILNQNALYPLLAKSVSLNIVLNRIKDIYCKNQEATPETVRFCCFIKPFVTWNTRDVAAVCVERSGG